MAPSFEELLYDNLSQDCLKLLEHCTLSYKGEWSGSLRPTSQKKPRTVILVPFACQQIVENIALQWMWTSYTC